MFIMHKILQPNFTSLPCFSILPAHCNKDCNSAATQYKDSGYTKSGVLSTKEKCIDTNENQSIHHTCAKANESPLTLYFPVGNRRRQYRSSQQNYHASIAQGLFIQDLSMDQPPQQTGHRKCPHRPNHCSKQHSSRNSRSPSVTQSISFHFPLPFQLSLFPQAQKRTGTAICCPGVLIFITVQRQR